MPSRYERIGVVKDEALAEALASAEADMGSAMPAATLVHALAIRGAQAVREEAAQRDQRLRDLADWSTGAVDPPWDRDVLARIDELTL